MRQKLQGFKREIRRKQIETYFSSRREELEKHYHQAVNTFIINEEIPHNEPRTLYSSQSAIQIQNEQVRQTENDIYQVWSIDQSNLQSYVLVGDYQNVLPIMNEIYYTLKRISYPKSPLHYKINDIYQHFLRTSLLGNMTRCVLLAHKDKITTGLFQTFSKRVIDILQRLIRFEPMQFSESIFLESNLLLMLRYCIDEPKVDKDHLSKIINIIVHMICVSSSDTGRLFEILNNVNNESFNISAPFYNLLRISAKPNEELTINFLIMMKFYFERIEFSVRQVRNKQNSALLIPMTLTKGQLDICSEIAINSFNFYANENYLYTSQNQAEDAINLEQSVDVIRSLIELNIMPSKWIQSINYRKMIELLSIRDFHSDIKLKILIIIDHLVFMDESQNFIYGFVKECQLLSTLWGLNSEFSGYVLNIFANIAASKDFKADLSPYVHNIFIRLKYQSNNNLIYSFIYNWFSSQNFEIKDSRDKLIIQLLKNSNETNQSIIHIECMIWMRLVQCGELIHIPIRILNFDNDAVKYIKERLVTQNNQI